VIVDNFAGGGGARSASSGRSAARPTSRSTTTRRPSRCTRRITRHAHYVEDVWKVDPVKACGGRPVGLAWFSPDCKHFSKAKGGKPVSKKIRGLAWIVVKWAKAVRPRVIMPRERRGVPDWGPLGEDNRPDKLRKGLTFRRWKASSRRSATRSSSASSSPPTTARRRRASASSSSRAATASRSCGREARQHGRTALPKWRAAAECIDWTLPCPSIFLTNDEAKPLGSSARSPRTRCAASRAGCRSS
jgi:DNA (cytosine-5)-methyltransferase 1